VVKTLIEKKQPSTQIERSHYPILVIYPQVWNQCFRWKKTRCWGLDHADRCWVSSKLSAQPQ